MQANGLKRPYVGDQNEYFLWTLNDLITFGLQAGNNRIARDLLTFIDPNGTLTKY